MGKRNRDFQEVAVYKEKFRSLSTQAIRYRLNELATGMCKAAVVALRQLLEERATQVVEPIPKDSDLA